MNITSIISTTASTTTKATREREETSFVQSHYIVGSAQMLFPFFFTIMMNPIGMCFHLIIHNLTRASSGPQAASRLLNAAFVAEILFDRVDILPETKIPIKTFMCRFSENLLVHSLELVCQL